jgi:hypothetical protein
MNTKVMTCETCLRNYKHKKCEKCEDRSCCFYCLKQVSPSYVHPKYPHLKRIMDRAYLCYEQYIYYTPKEEISDILLEDKDFEL